MIPSSKKERQRSARVDSSYDWPAMVAAGWTVARQEACYKLTRANHEITVNLPMGELWHKYDFEHSRNAMMVDDFVYFDGPAHEDILLRFTGALDRAFRGVTA